MYGLIGSFTAHEGKAEDLIAAMTQDIGPMPGCLSYVIARDATNPDKLWITEVWDSEESHKGSLAIPAVKAAIDKAMPLIAGFGDHIVTTPVGGHGI